MSDATLHGTTKPLQEFFDVALVDLDGVAYKGPDAIPSAPPALAQARGAGLQLIFVTNNASREPEEVSGQLSSLGIPTEATEVMTAAQAGAIMLTEHVAKGSRVLVIGGKGLRTAVAAAGYDVVDSADDAPAAVIQGYAPNIGWKDFAEATYAIHGGARFFATNLDMTLPTNRGMAPGNGALVGVVATATGVTPLAAGKPEPAMFHMAAERTGAQRPLAIGDRLDTDLKGARAANIPGLMVLTGVNDARDALLAPADQRPSFIGADLSCLAEAHPEPCVSGEWVHVGEARARVTEGHLLVDGGTDIDRVRAACVAAWAAADAGQKVVVETLPHLGVTF
ncbi:HAD-IIA family hydrolase [Demequina aurantiaca]|uniref:HAD-IIA family hydrolase n=1 Tax=Demequina aurantiaca TaxID=676200 RepID=UPI000783C2B1|nr:HAD-IIA family hydrolase [Demequina aurantiaca]